MQKKTYKITRQINLIWGKDRKRLHKGDPVEMISKEFDRWEERLGLEELENPSQDESDPSDSDEKTYHDLLAFAAEEGFLEESGRSKNGIKAYISAHYGEDQ